MGNKNNELKISESQVIAELEAIVSNESVSDKTFRKTAEDLLGRIIYGTKEIKIPSQRYLWDEKRDKI